MNGENPHVALTLARCSNQRLAYVFLSLPDDDSLTLDVLKVCFRICPDDTTSKRLANDQVQKLIDQVPTDLRSRAEKTFRNSPLDGSLLLASYLSKSEPERSRVKHLVASMIYLRELHE